MEDARHLLAGSSGSSGVGHAGTSDDRLQRRLPRAGHLRTTRVHQVPIHSAAMRAASRFLDVPTGGCPCRHLEQARHYASRSMHPDSGDRRRIGDSDSHAVCRGGSRAVVRLGDLDMQFWAHTSRSGSLRAERHADGLHTDARGVLEPAERIRALVLLDATVRSRLDRRAAHYTDSISGFYHSSAVHYFVFVYSPACIHTNRVCTRVDT